MRIHVLVVVLGLGLVACGGGPKAKSAEDADGTVKKVTLDDCHAWGPRFGQYTKAAFAKEMKICAAKMTDDPIARKKAERAGNKSFANDVTELEDKIVKGCEESVGKDYLVKDAKCFMGAKELYDWAGCDFMTPFFVDFGTLGRNFSAGAQKGCDESMEKDGGEEDGVHE